MARHIKVESSSAHWYQRDGKPEYEATLREARVHGLLVGASAISKMLPKPALDAWKINNAISHCYTMSTSPWSKQKETESPDDFLERVVDSYKSEVSEAAEIGTAVHEILSAHIEKREVDKSEVAHAAIKKAFIEHADSISEAMSWINKTLPSDRAGGANVEDHRSEYYGESEYNVVNLAEGYAGRVDFWGRYYSGLHRGNLAVVDFKTRKVSMTKRKTKPNKANPSFYMEDLMQLSAYAEAIRESFKLPKPPGVVSVIISTGEAKGIFTREWTEEEQKEGLQLFRLCLATWRIINKFPYISNMVHCDGCQEHYHVTRPPRSDRRNFCTKCRDSGVPGRLRQRRFKASKQDNPHQ